MQESLKRSDTRGFTIWSEMGGAGAAAVGFAFSLAFGYLR